MKAYKVGAVKYRSRSDYARRLLEKGKLTQMQIAKKVGVTPQTVNAVKRAMLAKADA
jgi:hypothetical protein